MVKNKVTIQETVDFLNSILKIDPLVITALFSMRISCNEKLKNHETVQVGVDGGYSQVGMIGILNGLFGKDQYKWGHICADYDNGIIKKFRLLTTENVAKIIEKQDKL